MPIALHHESGNTFRLDITGMLRRDEFGRCEAELASELKRVGSARLLCVLKEFDGWESDENWSNLSFFIKHGDAIERIAIVGEERWRDLSMMFASADLRKAPVEFFPAPEMLRARAWLSA
jgi:hypothetical protein